MDTDNWKIGEKLILKSLRNLDHLKDFNKLKPILYDLYYFTDYLLPVTTNTCHYFVGRYVWPFTVDSKTIHVMKEPLLCIPIKDVTELTSFFKKFSSGTLGSDVVVTKVFMDYVSPSFKYLPYMISESDNIFFFNVHDNVVLYDEIPNDYTNFQWYFDSGFYYIDGEKNRVYYHHINEGDSDDSTSEEDVYIYETTRIIKNIHISNNFGHLVIITEDENKCTTIECIFINNNYKICRIVGKSTYDYEYVGNNLIETNPEFYFKTNNGALNYKIISVSVVNINKIIISDTIEENDNKLLDCSYFNGNFLLYYSTNELLLVNENIKKLPLIHQNGYVTLCKSQYNRINCTTDIFYKYERATYPYVIYHHDLNTELTKSLKPSFSNIIANTSNEIDKTFIKKIKCNISEEDSIDSVLLYHTRSTYNTNVPMVLIIYNDDSINIDDRINKFNPTTFMFSVNISINLVFLNLSTKFSYSENISRLDYFLKYIVKQELVMANNIIIIGMYKACDIILKSVLNNDGLYKNLILINGFLNCSDELLRSINSTTTYPNILFISNHVESTRKIITQIRNRGILPAPTIAFDYIGTSDIDIFGDILEEEIKLSIKMIYTIIAFLVKMKKI